MSRLRNLSPRAAADLDQAVEWRLDHGLTPGSAEQLLRAVLAAAERLAERPLLGRQQPELAPPPFRFWSIPRWRLLLVYDPTSAPATIQRIVSTDQDLPPLLAELRGIAESNDPS